MAAQTESVVLASPFKVGFYAGLGFFFASALMSVLTVVTIALLGLGTIVTAVAGGNRWQAAQSQQATDAQPAAAELQPAPVAPARPTYHRKTRTYADN